MVEMAKKLCLDCESCVYVSMGQCHRVADELIVKQAWPP